MIIEAQAASGGSYDIVVAGAGFGSLFFIDRYLRRRPDTRVLMVERGPHTSHQAQLASRRHSPIAEEDTYRRKPGQKGWNFTTGWGGGLNCWYGKSIRLHPSDFKLKSLYGRAQDWPLTYDELEPYYVEAERIMEISGDNNSTRQTPRSAPFPQPPHRGNAVDRVMMEAYPDHHFIMPQARARVATARRGACCANFTCNFCPADAKFSANNGFDHLLQHPRIDTLLAAEVTHFVHGGGRVSGAALRVGGREIEVTGDLFVLGANAIHSPAILLRSGIDHPLTGRGLHEQYYYNAEVYLDGLDSLDGSTITTGLNYALMDGPFRRDYSGALLSFENRWPYGLRKEHKRWTQLAVVKIQLEEIPNDDHRVFIDSDGMTAVDHGANSAYADEGGKRAMEKLDRLLAPLPVERIHFRKVTANNSHIQGSLRMGRSRADSVVDAGQMHHDLRNLLVVGSAVWPSCSPANPSLTLAALSLRAADRLAA